MAKQGPARPGRPVRGSRSGRPIMVLLDLLSRRWALRVLWELRDGPLRFRALQQACGISPSVLNTRLAELREAGIVTLAPDQGYVLTPAGTDLLARVLPLHDWAEDWARRLDGTGNGA
ncbi:MAG TPA: helix-turn-helix domain-containing protein [Alphaproteobacteria bacterium]|nr:helix-turn-helix domain-containing protein [Alphaproteobacteria bacterium]